MDEDELFTVCLDDDGHPVQRAVRDMTDRHVDQCECVIVHCRSHKRDGPQRRNCADLPRSV